MKSSIMKNSEKSQLFPVATRMKGTLINIFLSGASSCRRNLRQ